MCALSTASSAVVHAQAPEASSAGEDERSTSQADAPTDEAAQALGSVPPCPRFRRRLAPVIALLAGPVVHGAGSLVGCHRHTGRQLALAEVGGLGALTAGGAGIIFTGASRKTIAPFTFLALVGVGIFSTSFISDLYATISNGEATGRPGPNGAYELSFGYRHVYDPQFDHGPLASTQFSAWLGHQRLFASLEVALNTDMQRGRGGFARRLLGGTGRGSSIELELASTWQRFGADGFATLTGELLLAGRLNLADFAPALVGSFVEGSLGVGLQTIGYQATSGGVREDVHALLLGRIAYGVYLGSTGEILVAYDHRRDGLEGGLSLNSVAAGNLGFLEVRGRGWFPGAPGWGVEAGISVGSAWTFGASLLHRGKVER